ncbi:protein tyrosine/serine phosphatase [Novosphingobium nitrogenifigens DSM 19370]|uniref:Protein tyrosine/serine phosphatase n=1 Tax=Novosphingobium nitrogenifigens DSM 19370 TaxID=983920 RepID=F1ZA86_9SPHN|nr:tyrosine-protein phosphatase [Novosphingobium nitrogenifigens]EGD58506.1 protein tyrosine/serine phosphatase [Novosphingobium nitrogenifigens DSM 19370]
MRVGMLFRLGFVSAIAWATAGVPAFAAPPDHVELARTDAATVALHWTSSDPVDVLVAERADAAPYAAVVVAHRVADGKASVALASSVRRYVLLRNARTGEITRVGERILPLEAGSNFRDIGGYPAAGGRHVRWGLIFRSGATPMLTPGDLAEVGQLHLTNMVDLRSDEERQLAPTRIDGVPYTAVGYSMRDVMVPGGMEGVYRGLPTLMQPQLRQVFARLLRKEGPLAYNCSAGQDRTGFVTAVILSALGTSYPVIVEDYHLSTQARHPQFEMPRIDPAQFPGNAAAQLFAHYQQMPNANVPQPLMGKDGKAFLDTAFDEIRVKWGSVEGYLHDALHLTDADIAALRQAYTE